MKFKILIAFVALFMSSCSSFMYSNKAANNTIRVNSNVSNYSVRFPLLGNQYGNKKDVTGKNWSYTLPELKKKYTTIEVSSENYETQRIEIGKSVRPVAVLMDLTLSLFTFGIPIIIDPFKSDFYKIDDNSKSINIDFVYKQSYMWSEYKNIKNSNSPALFLNFLNKYPMFENKNMVINTKDSVEFNIALSQNSESAITNFVKTHPTSIFASNATKIESQFVTNRTAFEKARNQNTIESYEEFIKNHIQAIQQKDAHVLLVDAAENKAEKSNSAIALISYQNDYLNTNKSFLTQTSFSEKQFKLQKLIKSQLFNELSKMSYNEFKDFYNTYSKINKSQINSNDLNNYLAQIKEQLSNLLVPKLLKFINESEQVSFVNSTSTDFPSIYSNSLILDILDNTTNKNGKITIYKLNYLTHLFNQKGIKNKYNNSITDTYSYKSINYTNLDSTDKQVLNFKNNLLEETQESYFKNELRYRSIFAFKQNNKEDFFKNNKLIETIYYDSDGSFKYKYEFENNLNLTLQQLDRDIKEVDNLFSNKRVEEALEGYKNLLNNKYPLDIAQNKNLNKKLVICQKAKDEKDRKEELVRQKEQQRLDKIRAIEEAKQAKIRQAEESRNRNSNNYSETIEGIYQADTDVVPGVHIYMMFNNKGVYITAQGYDPSVLSNPSRWMKSGTYTLSGQTIRFDDGRRWEYYGNSISAGEFTFNYVRGL